VRLVRFLLLHTVSMKRTRQILIAGVLAGLGACVGNDAPPRSAAGVPTSSEPSGSVPATEALPAPTTLATGPISSSPRPDLGTLEAAKLQIEEVRNSPGRIEIPDVLRHGEDNRRFLAVQMAASQEEKYALPHDQAELAEMIRRGEMVEVAPIGRDYLLYDVGEDAREDPLAHYDTATGKDVPLFASAAEYEAEDARLAGEETGRGRGAAQARDRRRMLASFYRDPEQARSLFDERATVEGLARNFGGQTYDLQDPQDRARFQARLLSFVRPPARTVLLTVAGNYHQKFGRLLPVTSLVRTQRYQRRLARVNPNATHVVIPPHTTGAAFDISYKFMPPDEQNFVMNEVAQLKQDGRVEALRERRNHIHVYAFEDGPPSESLVAQYLDDVEAARGIARAERHASRSGSVHRARGGRSSRAARTARSARSTRSTRTARTAR